MRPEFTHNAEAGLTYDGQPFFKLAYQRTTDVITLVTEQDPQTGITEAYDLNLDTYIRYGGQLFAPLSFIPRVEGFTGVMAYYNDYRSNYLGGQLDASRWNIVAFLNAQVEMVWDLKGELNFWYAGGGQEGIIGFGPLYGSSVGVQRSWMDGQLEANLSFEDPIRRFWQGEIDYQTQQISIKNFWETRILNASINYKFGNRYLKRRESRESAGGDVLRRVGSE